MITLVYSEYYKIAIIGVFRGFYRLVILYWIDGIIYVSLNKDVISNIKVVIIKLKKYIRDF